MTLYLSEKDVVSLLPMNVAVNAVENVLRELGNGNAQNQPRQRVRIGDTTLNVMPASIPSLDVLGVKNYTTTPKGPTAYFLLFSKQGSLLCLMEADELGRIRTGATSALATRFLARANSKVAALIGTGFQAETQLKALCETKHLEAVKVWSRRFESAVAFCGFLQSQVDVRLEPVVDLRTGVRDADIVTIATSAAEPVLFGDWLKKGAHVNAVGNNRAYERELDSKAVAISSLIITDYLQQAMSESGDLILAASDGVPVWDRVKELADLVTGRLSGRISDEQVTMFKSNGLAVEDVAVACHVYHEALRLGTGIKLPI